MAAKDGKKGTFSFLRLPIAKQYVWPDSRFKMVLIGLIICLGFAAYFAYDYFFNRSRFISNGPLSSYHANFENDCKSCHTPLKTVTSAKCSVCHELYGDKVGTYTYPAHYIYRSGDTARLKIKSHDEAQCFSCHTEHVGRNAAITDVPDSKCLACHQFGSFNKNHPQFAFAAKHIPDDANLEFPHTKHVQEVMKKGNLQDIEKACLYCHHPKPDGKSFQPISFDQSCDACHLTSVEKTDSLPIKDVNTPDAPGVETLETIQAKNEPGSMWAYFINPKEIQKRGDGLVKQPLYHEDPWIMENLRMIRRTLYPNLGIEDLLQTAGLSGDSSKGQTTAMYQEAVQTLQQYETELRGRPEPEVQDDLRKIDAVIKTVQRKIQDPSVELKPDAFLTSPKLNPKLNKDQVEALRSFALDLTAQCRKCHVVSDASILRVQKDQTVLHRAEFNHRAHVLQRRCLDCHNVIPVESLLKVSGSVKPELDNAALQNIPTIENCRTCHAPEQVSNRCITCHEFHPNKTVRSRMLLYLD